MKRVYTGTRAKITGRAHVRQFLTQDCVLLGTAVSCVMLPSQRVSGSLFTTIVKIESILQAYLLLIHGGILQRETKREEEERQWRLLHPCSRQMIQHRCHKCGVCYGLGIMSLVLFGPDLSNVSHIYSMEILIKK